MSRKALSALERLILNVQRRLFLRIFVAGLLPCLAVALVLVAIWFVLQPILLAQASLEWKWAVAGGILAGGIVTALVRAFLRAPSGIAAALAVDEAFGLKERVTTYLTLPPQMLHSPAGQALAADVQERVASLQLAGKFPLHVSWSTALLPVCASVLALVAFFFEPFWTAGESRAGGTIPVAAAKEIQQQLDNLKKVSLGQRDEKLPKSEELKELEKAWDKLVKQPAPKTEEQIRDRVKEMRSLEDKLKDRIRDLAGKNDALKKQLERLNLESRKTGNKELNELEEALARKKINEAVAALDRLAKKLKDKELTKEERQNLAEQLHELQQKLQKLAENKELKDKLQREFDKGKITKEQLECEMERLAKQAENFKELQKLAELLGDCKGCLNAAKDAELLEKMEMIKGQLKEIELSDEEMRALLEDQEQLDAAREAMLMALNDLEDGDGMQKSRFPGARRPTGKDPKDSKITNARQHAESDPMGQQRITGFTKGGVFSRIPARDIGGAFKQAVQDAPEAIERQRIPPDAADMAKGYFEKLSGQK